MKWQVWFSGMGWEDSDDINPIIIDTLTEYHVVIRDHVRTTLGRLDAAVVLDGNRGSVILDGWRVVNEFYLRQPVEPAAGRYGARASGGGA